ncbi:GNAT family N-acetyltransferase [Mycolicibacterium mucogenicum]|uniref:GNAT family N-acetyltransferase n=1 Tax=Mycolicibacterium mucogenicum TaxID=56689 RepID=UPI001F2E3E3A|nr:GNAT family N-acetyltransferase [Mycolicibacterium mucogenicum]
MGDAIELRASCLEGPRVRLRKARDEDAEGLIETQTDERVRRYLGGPRPVHEVRAVLEGVGAATLLEAPGCYIATATDSDDMLGTVTLSRRRNDVPGHLGPGGDELELSYVFRPHTWGRGYASEAARLLLEYAAGELDDQPVVIITQTANRASLRLAERLGFSVVATFEQYDAEQALATARLATFLRTDALRADS